MKKEIGIVGMGKMGKNIALNLVNKGWYVVAFDRDTDVLKRLPKSVKKITNLIEFKNELKYNRIIWVMVPSGNPTHQVILGKNGLISFLEKGDLVIDGGNSFYEDSINRAKVLKRKGIYFMDVGVSGGPKGARNGASLMVGGNVKIFEKSKELFKNIAIKDGYGYMGKVGSGHFVKMVHNGIEYGMMQSIAEGFAIMKKSPLKPNLKEIARIYNHGSVIQSNLIGWMESAYKKFGINLKEVSGSVNATGEGEWTIKTAKKLKILTPSIKSAFDFRVESWKKPSYTGKVLSVLRNQFGGHSIKPKSRRKV